MEGGINVGTTLVEISPIFFFMVQLLFCLGFFFSIPLTLLPLIYGVRVGFCGIIVLAF